jgi:hypothetical protein
MTSGCGKGVEGAAADFSGFGLKRKQARIVGKEREEKKRVSSF